MVRPPSADKWVADFSPDPKGTVVIQLTRLNGNPIALNSDLIKFVENAPDTVITLINGEKIIVRETSDDVIHRILDFRRAVMAGLPSWGGSDVNSATLHPQENHPNRTPEAFRRG
jgi:flagellar protein FlbD